MEGFGAQVFLMAHACAATAQGIMVGRLYRHLFIAIALSSPVPTGACYIGEMMRGKAVGPRADDIGMIVVDEDCFTRL